MSHTSSTTISRYFKKEEERALVVFGLVCHFAEFLLPILIYFYFLFFHGENLAIYFNNNTYNFTFSSFYTIKNVTISSREENILKNNKKI